MPHTLSCLLSPRFQSTLPHGERLPPTCSACRTPYFNPRSRMGSDPLAWPRSSATPLFQSTLPHGERPVYRKDITEEIEISIHAPAWGATFTKRAYVKVWQFQSTLPHGERPSTPQNHPTQQTFQSTLPHGERQGRNGLGHDRRRISIHAPAWGATKESIRRVPVVCYFNPRSRMGSDRGRSLRR